MEYTLMTSSWQLRCLFAAWLICAAAGHGQAQPCDGFLEEVETVAPRNAIVIGFVGGFVDRDDPDHPEVQFSAWLRERYPSTVRTAVFKNREQKKALRQILDWLAADGSGKPTGVEKRDAAIIIYGHSWGASQTVELARQLGRRGIPVLLTIQVDSIEKAGQDDSRIPRGVRKAINFFQTRGLIQGRRAIRAEDPERTTILGNIELSYQGSQVNSDHCSWFARTFSRTHCQIESDTRVWDQITSLVESELGDALETGSAITEVWQQPVTGFGCIVGETRVYRNTTKAWSNEEVESLLTAAGFCRVSQRLDWPCDTRNLALGSAETG
jgi:pimeloyl-ACP methyl ester carboxylesterase